MDTPNKEHRHQANVGTEKRASKQSRPKHLIQYAMEVITTVNIIQHNTHH